MAFVIKKKISLADFGEGWEQCYISFNSPTYRDIKELLPSVDAGDEIKSLDSALDMVKRLFLSGKAFDGESVVDLKSDDLSELPVAIIIRCFSELAGKTDPKLNES